MLSCRKVFLHYGGVSLHPKKLVSNYTICEAPCLIWLTKNFIDSLFYSTIYNIEIILIMAADNSPTLYLEPIILNIPLRLVT